MISHKNQAPKSVVEETNSTRTPTTCVSSEIPEDWTECDGSIDIRDLGSESSALPTPSVSPLSMSSRSWKRPSDRVNPTTPQRFGGSINKLVKDAEAEIPAKYWIKTDENTKGAIEKFKRDIRLSLRDEGVHDKKALKLLWKIRCGVDPTRAECSAPE